MLLDIEQYIGGFLNKNDNIGTHYFSWNHEDVIQWKRFPPYWPFVRIIHRSSVNYLNKGPVIGKCFVLSWRNHDQDAICRIRGELYIDFTIYMPKCPTTSQVLNHKNKNCAKYGYMSSENVAYRICFVKMPPGLDLVYNCPAAVNSGHWCQMSSWLGWSRLLIGRDDGVSYKMGFN